MARKLKPLPRYCYGYRDRHGRYRVYLRRPGRKGIALPSDPDSPEFWQQYSGALAESAPVIIVGAERSKPGTAAQAVAHYLASAAFAELAPSTRAMRRAILERFREDHGDKRMRLLNDKGVEKLLATLRPWAQRNWL